MTVVVYPGTFDPITNGHLDVIHRAARLFNRVIVAVAESRNKRPLFTHQERVEMVRQAVQDVKNVEVEGFTGLLIEYVHRKNANAVLRGLRAVSDFEFEFQLALVNRKLSKDFETIFMMPKRNIHVSKFECCERVGVVRRRRVRACATPCKAST